MAALPDNAGDAMNRSAAFDIHLSEEARRWTGTPN